MADIIDFERENERLLIVLKRTFRQLEIAKERNVQLEQELDQSRRDKNADDLKIVQLQKQNDELRALNADIAPLRIDTVKQPCAKCKKVHPGEAKVCTLFDAIKANDIPGTRAYLTVCNGGELEQEYFTVFGRRATPLEWASHQGFFDVADMLLKAGARREQKGPYGAIHHASSANHTPILRLLLERGVNINIADADGDTPIHNAALNGTGYTVNFLLVNGANPTIKNKRGETPLDCAKRRNNHEAVRILEHYARR